MFWAFWFWMGLQVIMINYYSDDFLCMNELKDASMLHAMRSECKNGQICFFIQYHLPPSRVHPLIRQEVNIGQNYPFPTCVSEWHFIKSYEGPIHFAGPIKNHSLIKGLHVLPEELNNCSPNRVLSGYSLNTFRYSQYFL